MNRTTLEAKDKIEEDCICWLRPHTVRREFRVGCPIHRRSPLD